MEYGLIGEKLGHSFSKEIHEKLADYNYILRPLTKEEIPSFMKSKDFKAINVTIPYKQDVIPYLDEIDETVRNIGAVNTIVNRNHKLIGYNTDYNGFLYTIVHNQLPIEGRKIIILGNGGASKAVIAVLEYLKAKEIIIVNRTLKKGVITYEECYKNHLNGEVIINTTPVGMYPDVDVSPLDLVPFKECKYVIDIIYNPLKTKFLIEGESLGKKTVNGLEMLIAQAKYAVEYFLDTKIEDSVIDKIYKDYL